MQTGRGSAELHGPVLAALDGLRIGRVTSREPSLEDAYITIVEEAAGAVDPSVEPAETAVSADAEQPAEAEELAV
ncbi:hypothetical protein [Streptomyces narbonensis]